MIVFVVVLLGMVSGIVMLVMMVFILGSVVILCVVLVGMSVCLCSGMGRFFGMLICCVVFMMRLVVV